MKTTITRDAICCDGCDYIIENGVRTIALVVREEMFDFHDGGQGNAERHDCFRFWAHNPDIMKRSLGARDWDEDRIEEFMSLMLYRSSTPGSPGMARPVKA